MKKPSQIVSLASIMMSLHAVSVSAQPVSNVDDTAAAPIADGIASPGDYSGESSGINSGFGGVLGAATLGVDADAAGNLVWSLRGSTGDCSGNNHVVIYIDSRAGGISSTSAITDTSDPGRRAISGSNASGDAHLNFGPGFAPDYAIVITRSFVGTFSIDAQGLTFGEDLTTSSTFGAQNCDVEISGSSTSKLGVNPGASIRYVATLLNPDDAAGPFRSDEFHGVAAATVASGNPGQSTVTLGANDFNTFTTPRILINEIDADTPGSDSEEFVELLTAPADMDMSGVVLVAYNGSDDASYTIAGQGGVELSGVSGADGLFVVGSASVPNVDQVVGDMLPTPSQNLIQNGADAVTLYIGEAATFPNDSTITTVNLIDAVVYGTSDSDDMGLISGLLASAQEPQVDENKNADKELESSQRCEPGARQTTSFIVSTATPGAINAACTCTTNADCGVCEVCDMMTNKCEQAPVGATCDEDANACTLDTCDAAGACVTGSTIDCSASSDDCNVGTCDPMTGQCGSVPSNEGMACDDGDTCTTMTSCVAGSCAGGDNTCQCQQDSDCAMFEDGDACNGTLICDSSKQCVVDPSTTVTCDGSMDTACMENTCAPATGECAMQPANIGAGCDDQNACTENETCDDAGACVGAAVADGTTCEADQDRCTPDTCQAGVCEAAAGVLDCSSLDSACSAGVCDEQTGECVTEPIADGTSCDDGDACTQGDVCESGTCNSGMTNTCGEDMGQEPMADMGPEQPVDEDMGQEPTPSADMNAPVNEADMGGDVADPIGVDATGCQCSSAALDPVGVVWPLLLLGFFGLRRRERWT